MAGLRLLPPLLLLLACIVELAMANLVDGIPRPPGFAEEPTASYGLRPPCLLNGVVANCEWYGFAHLDHPSDGRTCMAHTRAILANTTLVRPGALEPYAYYYLEEFIFNTTTNDSYCLYGCFDLTGGGTPPVATPPPATVATPPPVTVATPPVATPPPVTVTPPPLLPATPPGGALAPTTPTTPPPPPPPPTTQFVFAGAGLLQPRGFVSFVISGALLVLHGILG